MISTSEVVSRVTHWWQQTMKDVVIVRADIYSMLTVASSAPKKWRGPNHISLLVSSKSYNIHTIIQGIPICKKLFNGFVLTPRGV